MENRDLSDDQLISLISYRPDDIASALISIRDPPATVRITRDDRFSSLGLLDTLPVELLHVVLKELDLRSLSLMSMVSLRARKVARALPAHKDLLEFVPHAIAALGRTGLASTHSVATLHIALYSERCISCNKYAAYLFLPTCERCCYECLHWNPSLWMLPTSLIIKCFNITKKHIKGLPELHSIPGSYFAAGRAVIRRRRSRLTSVKMAIRQALIVHGSMENITKSLPPVPHTTAAEFYLLRQLRETFLEPVTAIGLPLRHHPNKRSNDNYCGMASIEFPSLLPNRVPNGGYWCLGCEHVFRDRSAEGGDLFFLLRQAKSRAEFLEHIKQCSGATEILSRDTLTEVSSDP